MRRQGPRGRARAARLSGLRPQVLQHWGAFCMACGRRGPLDLHHVVKRSQGGQDTVENIVPLCRRCHDATDAPSGRGKRLTIEPNLSGFDLLWT
jgi:5-methylcytosine-specific restriction endonuclease McrA